jgi:teichuronic acid biosynthesis glycosyltransferase TuaH
MNLSNKVVFILGIAKFDGPFESTSYTVAKYLSKANKVFYIDYPYTWKDYYNKKDQSFLKRKDKFSSGTDGILKTDSENLNIIIVPPLLSINFLKEGWLYRLLLMINERIIVKRIKKVIHNFNVTEFTFINSFNFHYPGVGKLLKSNLYVYHCVDPLIVDYDTRHGIISERQIIEDCDLVVCTSRQLFKDKSELNSNTHFIPNAADIIHSNKATQSDLAISKIITDIPRPIIGYFGNIERRIDFKMLEEVVSYHPDFSFVFAGPVEEHYIPDSFKKRSNVYFVGRVPYEEMPAVLKGFDVAMIPFKKDEVSRTIFPLKLFEYLGTGRPVVATDFNLDLMEFTADTIHYSSDAKEFSAQIILALNQDTKAKQDQRVKIASENSWERRLSEFSELIDDCYLKASEKS